ncbi:Agmatine/peptidylarginine deiminase [Allopseudospirillum japonicum]|uniref:Agmatine/peptidylarginine deiminase n=1 Tax=Allopseudospirillum japonicum TaxID=64971 RepID=A0A1H6QEG0_9GAMM|nr:agmatine deiminase family protein [Allopseudospirillum japonicum]SEI38617.1 Agmatine/peptidylarginine deiminase [Allopseudospirillum japonicum]
MSLDAIVAPACTKVRLLPPEWYPQDAVMLTWPHEQSDWADWLSEIEATYWQLVQAISRFEKVLISAHTPELAAKIRHQAQALGLDSSHIQVYVLATQDTWARDHGPISLIEGNAPVLLNYTFNGWGDKFAAEHDNAINQGLAEQGAFAAPLETHPLVLEGGSIESDGLGTLLTTEACLLNPNRNPTLDRTHIQAQLEQQLGVTRILWLKHGYLAGDDTDSHIDTLVRFCDPHTLAYVQCLDTQDEHYAELQAMEEELKALQTAQGTPYHLVPLPMPQAIYAEDGHRLPATYANFLIINQAVLVPVYNDPADAQALAQLRYAFPHHQLIPIDSRVIIEQHGSIHCLTMQLIQGTLTPTPYV